MKTESEAVYNSEIVEMVACFLMTKMGMERRGEKNENIFLVLSAITTLCDVIKLLLGAGTGKKNFANKSAQC